MTLLQNLFLKHLRSLNLYDLVSLQNFLLAYDHYYNNLPQSLIGIFKLVKNTHLYNTRNSNLDLLTVPSVNTTTFGIHSIHYQSIICWNKLLKLIPNLTVKTLSKRQCKDIITNHYLENY